MKKYLVEKFKILFMIIDYLFFNRVNYIGVMAKIKYHSRQDMIDGKFESYGIVLAKDKYLKKKGIVKVVIVLKNPGIFIGREGRNINNFKDWYSRSKKDLQIDVELIEF